ncbi:hypothetical protein PO124_27135 [Bacillus licheniformis]|nr:hypothetical protein [Bacillus licheniformis]
MEEQASEVKEPAQPSVEESQNRRQSERSNRWKDDKPSGKIRLKGQKSRRNPV